MKVGENLKNKTFFVQLTIGETKGAHFGEKVESFKNVDGFPEGCEIFDCENNVDHMKAFVMDYEFSVVDDGSPECEALGELDETKDVITALRFCSINENQYILEFDEDAYAEFLLLTKMDNGFYFSVV